MKTETKQSIEILILGLTIGLGVFITSAFNPPVTTPGTVGPSILNTEPENQIKSGGLGVNSFLVTDYDASFLAGLTVGTAGGTSNILNIGYDTSNNKISGSGNEITTNMTIPQLTSSTGQICADASGTLVLCNPPVVVVPAPGVCGTAVNNPASYTAPTSNFCNVGNASAVTSDVYTDYSTIYGNPNTYANWDWTCNAVNGKDGNAYCSAKEIVNGKCDATGCTVGNMINKGDIWMPGGNTILEGSTWKCDGINGGSATNICVDCEYSYPYCRAYVTGKIDN